MEKLPLLHLIEKRNIMQPIKNISIPQPCHQNWNQMTPVEQGRHCTQCSKKVTDFASMTNTEIVNYFAHNGHVCGRFGETQLAGLNNYLAVVEKPGFSWKKLTIAAAVTSLFATVNANAQHTLGKVKVSQSVNQIKDAPAVDSITYVVLKGKIISSDDKLPVVGAAVYLKDKSIGTQTNASGDFTLKVPANDVHTLIVSFIGYKNMEVNAAGFLNGSTTVMLQISPALMGEVVIVKRPTFIKRCWHKLKRVF
nr:carboxypeptidase-like regulatory domain-containing protein [Mucilaginibacter sp. L294]